VRVVCSLVRVNLNGDPVSVVIAQLPSEPIQMRCQLARDVPGRLLIGRCEVEIEDRGGLPNRAGPEPEVWLGWFYLASEGDQQERP